eukprot:UN32536
MVKTMHETAVFCALLCSASLKFVVKNSRKATSSILCDNNRTSVIISNKKNVNNDIAKITGITDIIFVKYMIPLTKIIFKKCISILITFIMQ